jgi:MYXO-CTERM domain-containing protein
VLIESSEFANNGHGDGYSHNMYLNHYAKFTLQYSYSHGAKVGHLVKSRALENHILYNRITDETGTTASYEIDLPNAGASWVIGNLIEQSATTQNPGIVSYGEEPNGINADQHLWFVNNTVVNDAASGTFVVVAITTPAVIMNNIFVGPGKPSSQANAMLTTNYTMGSPMLVAPASYDYHLQPGSPCVDTGTDPGNLLLPTRDYVHPLGSELRTTVKTIDIGAYELGGSIPDDGGAGGDAGGTGGDGGGTSDAGPNADGGSGSPSSGGCSCDAANGSTSSGAAWLVIALIFLRRKTAR